MDTLCLDVHSQCLELKDGSLPFAVSYRIYFKLMYTNLSPKALGVSPKGYTMLMEVNVEKSSMTIPKTHQWEEIIQNPVWKLQGVIALAKRTSIEALITEFLDGNIKIEFNPEARYPRIRKIMNRRPNTSLDIRTVNSFLESFKRSGSMRAVVDFTHPIPDVHYEREEGSASPTQSDMERRSEPIYNQINVITNACYEEMYSKYIDMWLAASEEGRKHFPCQPNFITGIKQKEQGRNKALVKTLETKGQV
ncbi:receptor-like serine/threonine-protein kinase ALE2 [Cucumis melo var. makuwa]|uniref:Receptor-like serine/threonine-protein kinase ALE2 n=1 Tax=Cucumis melo var. makuwa TaxID=1194695 RepID=A0A5A7UBP5_CUCMM|nr:receptor-like serine/threonine-protein kinase ALE2 [Cucumis melo var. makuwa]TYK30790.1 receptor-like serine/threonine-protein kinase ALE2 [Cucumis melo var. makuwa]